MEFHRLSLHRPRYLMLLKYLTMFHPDIWNHRCQATNLAGSSEQTTPVTVRHAGESNVQCPKCDFNFNFNFKKNPKCNIHSPKVWGTGPFFRYSTTLIKPYDCLETITVPSWFLFYSDSVPRRRPLSHRQLLSERGQLRLLQVHRRAGLQVIRRDLIQSPLVISCVRPKHKQIL